jgi:capsular polysaccharide biosynthesis protein
VASSAAQRATEGLEQAVTALRQRVAQSDQAYEICRGTFEAHSGRELLGTQTEEASKELTAAEVARQVLEARLAELRGLTGRNPGNDATSEVTESRVMQTLHEQAAGLQGRPAELSTTMGDANPQVQQVRAALGRVYGEMHSEVARQTAALEAELKVSIAKEASPRQSLAATRTESAQASPGEAKLDALKVEAESNRAALNGFLNRLHEANTSAKLLRRANAEIVAPANAPLVPTFPKTKLLLVLAAFGSTMAGFVVAIAREKAASTFRSGEEIEVETGIRTLALVPLIDNPKAPPEEALASLASFYGEAIRTLYTTLLLRQRVKMFVVTSARPRDGKTTLATSLALTAAKAGRKVLLVDADLCTAGASRIFPLAGHEGVAELIAGSKGFSEVVATGGANANFHFLAAWQCLGRSFRLGQPHRPAPSVARRVRPDCHRSPAGACRGRRSGVVGACRCDFVCGTLGFDAARRRQARPQAPARIDARGVCRRRAEDGRRARALALRLFGFSLLRERPSPLLRVDRKQRMTRTSVGGSRTFAGCQCGMTPASIFRRRLRSSTYRRWIGGNRSLQAAFLRHSLGDWTACASR